MSNTNTPATVAFVGCAHIHTPGFINTLNERDDVVCKYVYDHETARAEKRAGEIKSGPTVATSYEQIYADPDVKAVIVCTETIRHEEVVLPGAAAGKHLFVEKPLGFASRDAYAMAKAIDDAGIIYSTGYFQRGDAKNIFLKKQVDAGAFGKITRVRGANCHSGALGRWFDTEWRWMADPKISGVGAFGDLGTHSLDILLWIFGKVTAVTAQIDPGTGAYPGCDETGEGLLRFESGTIGTLAAAWDDVASPVTYLISGTEGHAAVINGQVYFQSKHVEGADGKTPFEIPAGRPAALPAFLNAIVGQTDAVLVTAQEAAYRSAVMEALYIGANEDRWVVPAAG